MFLKLLLFLLLFCQFNAYSQSRIKGMVHHNGKGVNDITVEIKKQKKGAITDSSGNFILDNISGSVIEIQASGLGYKTILTKIQFPLKQEDSIQIEIEKSEDLLLNDVVVTGTMKSISKSASTVAVDIISSKLFQKNPTPSLFEAVGMVTGVQPQINCNVCNTGDIHINGMEGPYTLILIDGMPIVSALATVYGLSGIPNSMVDRIEIIKGPAASLYGSEAMGGIINVITKSPLRAPLFNADIMQTSWGETNIDVSTKIKTKKSNSLIGINFFNFDKKIDKNGDGFTDITLQKRLSIFNKWNFSRKHDRLASLAARFVYEDRWGGQINWNTNMRGSDSIYAETIYTRRVELIGSYQLPFKEKIFTQLSFNHHYQHSYYGTTPYFASQQVGFFQMYWDKNIGKNHSLLTGGSIRITKYDDNTVATSSPDQQKTIPAITVLPGIFIQDDWQVADDLKILLGYRLDMDKNHGLVHSPRLAIKKAKNNDNIFRLSVGTGFRVVNIFTEDHAALTGARKVDIVEDLLPERSWNTQFNYIKNLDFNWSHIGLDATVFYSHFTNKIIADLDTDPQKIIYKNLNGYAVSKGLSLSISTKFNFPLQLVLGTSYMKVYQQSIAENNIKEKTEQLHAPKWSGNFIATYILPKNWSLDLTGNWNGPMRLPILPNDYRPEYSPFFSIINIQATKKLSSKMEIYGGIKNIFNFVPSNPIMRPFDPFNKTVDNLVSNPNRYIFDPSYNYASMQGIRGFLGCRWTIK